MIGPGSRISSTKILTRSKNVDRTLSLRTSENCGPKPCWWFLRCEIIQDWERMVSFFRFFFIWFCKNFTDFLKDFYKSIADFFEGFLLREFLWFFYINCGILRFFFWFFKGLFLLITNQRMIHRVLFQKLNVMAHWGVGNYLYLFIILVKISKFPCVNSQFNYLSTYLNMSISVFIHMHI